MRLSETTAKLDYMVAWLAGAAVACMLFQICIDVILKYVFWLPVPGTITTVISYYMPMIAFLPLAYVQRTNQHIFVESFSLMMPDSLQRHLTAFMYLFSGVMFTLLAWVTFQQAFIKARAGTFIIEDGFAVATWPGYFCPPIGFMLSAIVCWAFVIEYVLGKTDANAR